MKLDGSPIEHPDDRHTDWQAVGTNRQMNGCVDMRTGWSNNWLKTILCELSENILQNRRKTNFWPNFGPNRCRKYAPGGHTLLTPESTSDMLANQISWPHSFKKKWQNDQKPPQIPISTNFEYFNQYP